MRGGAVVIAGVCAMPALVACGLATSGLLAPDVGAPGPTIEAGAPLVGDGGNDAGSIGVIDASDAGDGGAVGWSGDASWDAAPIDACGATSDAGAAGTVASIAKPPKIDGDLSDWPCDGHLTLTAQNAAYVKANGGDVSAGDLALRWDKDNVYVAIHVVDANVSGGDTIDPYKNDSVEIYVTGDAAPNGDYDATSHQFVCDWKGLVVDYGPAHSGQPPDTRPAHFVSAQKKASDGWTFEAAIGWQAILAASYASGTSIGLDFEINDGDGTQQVGALVLAMLPAPSTCTCTQQECCCGQSPDLPYCDSARISRTTLE